MGGVTKTGSQRVAVKTSSRELVNEKQLSAELNAGRHPFCSIFSEAALSCRPGAASEISSVSAIPPNILSVNVSRHQVR